MAFLLSPKTGEGVAYALVSYFEVSVNGAAPQAYAPENPGTVKTGDVITSTESGNLVYAYVANDAPAVPIMRGAYESPFTVVAVAGADRLEIASIIS